MVLGEVRRPGRQFTINDLSYQLATEEQASQLGRRRAWDLAWLVDQQADPSLPFEIDLGALLLGGGVTFADAPGSYESAQGFDFTPQGIVTWPRLAQCEDFPAGNGARRARIVFFGGYLYIARGAYVAKYQPAVDQGGTWGIKELHFLGSTNYSTTGGRWAAWGGSLYVPVVDSSSGTLQKFQRITTQSVTVTEVQTVIISGTPTGGTYTLTFNDGFGAARTTAAIAYNADGAAVQAALRLIPGLEKVTVVTTGSTPNYTHTITMTGAPSAAGTTSPPQLTSSSSLTGGTPSIAHATSTAGTGDRWDEGPAGKESVAFVVQGEALVRAEANVVSKAFTDPMTAGNWGAEYAVGETGEPITDLAVYPGQDIIVGKTDGPWVFNASNYAEPAIPELVGLTDDFNCVGMDYAHGYVLIPHRVGLVRWRPGAWEVVGAEQDLLWEVDPDIGGWGRTTGIATYGKRSYLAIDERTGQLPYVHSISPNGRRAGGLTPHVHQAPGTDGLIEGAAIATFAGQAMPAGVPGAAITDDNAVGTITWSNPTNSSAEDDTPATAAAGISHYLKHLTLGLDGYVPADATILGVEARVRRRKTASSAATAATSPGTGANNNRGGTNAWSNPTNILSSNNSHATCATSGTTQHLEATNFGFAIPTLATILGITVEVERKASVLGGTSTTVQFTQSGEAEDGWTRDGGANPDGEASNPDGGLLVGNSGIVGNPDNYRSYLRFDTSSIPNNATITSARLRLYQTGGHYINFDVVYYDHGGGITYGADHYATDSGTATNWQNDSGGSSSTNPSWSNLSSLSNINKSGNTGFRLQFPSSAFLYAGIAGYANGASYWPILEVTYTEPGVKDNFAGLIKADGTIGSQDKAATSTYWPTTDAYATYGGAADLWGDSWTPADINDADFGVSLRATIEDSGITASVDHIRVTVTYSLGDVVDSTVKLVKGGVVSGSNKADTSTQWPTTYGYKSYGGSGDLWGTTLTAADVRASNFGFVFSCNNTSGTAEVDRIDVRVYFTSASDPAAILVVGYIANSTVVGSCYHLGTGTLPPGLDPYIDRRSQYSQLRSSRYYAPNRRVRKTYVEVEGVCEFTDGTTAPTNNYVKIEASVDGAAFVELLSAPGGSAIRIKSDGRFRAYMPLGAGSVGYDIQILATVVGQGDTAGIAVRLRDLCIRGIYEPRTVEGGTVTLILDPGGRNEAGAIDSRTLEQMRADLKALVGGDGSFTTQLASIIDPWDRSGYVKVHDVKIQEVVFKGDQKPTLAAMLELRKVAYP